MRKLICFLLLTGIACSKNPKVENPTDAFLPGNRLAELKRKQLSEVSGLAASINNPGYLWAHNDSGNGAEVYLIDQKLKIKLTYTLEGIENRDWEDIAVGPGPDSSKQYVYIAEIGDNDARYQYKHIYRFEEPIAQDEVEEVTISQFDTITFMLPDKKKDTEALMIDPNTKDLYIISKREEPVHVYQLKYPYATRDTLTANMLVALPLTQIVAADFSADGKEVLMKNYEHIYYWNNRTNKPLEALLKEKPQEVPYELESQGESIAWARDASGFFTLSEKNVGKDSYLYFYRRK